MSLTEEEHTRLGGPLPLLAGEAAAGAGKTHVACRLAAEAVAGLRPYQQVLFLSHTNAARDVFRRRVVGSEGSNSRVTITTLDSFCMEILDPYARLWNLPVPLRPPRPLPKNWFAVTRHKAAILLSNKPAIASAIVARFPFIVADEHQDASRDHHLALMSLARAGARIRMFGDALQAILTFDRSIPGWDQLMRDIPTISLSGSWRWTARPQLGKWISNARHQLLQGKPVHLSTAPDCVEIVETDYRGDRWSRNHHVIELLGRLVGTSELVVLGRRTDDVKEIARTSDVGLVVNEGSDYAAVEEVIAEVIALSGDARGVAAAFVDYMESAGTLQPASGDAIRGLGVADENASLSAVASTLREHPDLTGLARATRMAKRSATTIGWEIVHPVSVHIIASLPDQVGADEVRELVYQAQRAATEAPMPARCSSTIHKAKGREFGHVVIPSLDSRTFRDSVEDRQLLYVALSRATLNLTLVVPKPNPSPLIQF